MTISSTANRTNTDGDGSVTAFSFPYLFFADDDLTVILVVDSTGAETVKTISTHYTVSGKGNAAGGTVTMVTAPASGETLVIIRKEQFTQTLDLVENDPFPSALVEQQFDSLTMLAQQMNTEITRSMKLSDGDTTVVDLTLPTPIASTGLAWNAAANALENAAISGTLPDPVTIGKGGTGQTSAAAAATALGLGTGNSPQFAGINVGHATDTTITRSAAGVIAVEGVAVVSPVGQHTIFVPAAAMEPAVTTAPAANNVVEIGTSLFAARTLDFATGADDFAYFGVQMPKSWDAGTLICQFVWSATGTTANTVLWGIAATSLGNDEVLTTAFATPTSPAADTNSTTADDLMISAEVAVTVGSTPTAEDYVIFEVSRVVSGDTLAEDARLHGIKIHYTTDAGSDT
tara:strand:- start:144 stop:1352 length:1209 start_codon:yes stop_codon:yes gene_type:complete